VYNPFATAIGSGSTAALKCGRTHLPKLGLYISDTEVLVAQALISETALNKPPFAKCDSEGMTSSKRSASSKYTSSVHYYRQAPPKLHAAAMAGLLDPALQRKSGRHPTASFIFSLALTSQLNCSALRARSPGLHDVRTVPILRR
jgi:hypothetical protein